GRLGCVVGVHDATAGGRGVFSNVLQVADGRLEAVLHGTQLGALAVDLGDGAVQYLDCLLSAFSSGNVQVGYGGRLNYRVVRCCITGVDTQSSEAGAGRAISDSEDVLRKQT